MIKFNKNNQKEHGKGKVSDIRKRAKEISNSNKSNQTQEWTYFRRMAIL